MNSNRAAGGWLRVLLFLALCSSFATGRVPKAFGADLTPAQVESAREEQQRHLQHLQRLPRQLHEEQQPSRLAQVTRWLHRLHAHYSVIEGYDHNPNLGSPRKGSGFTEQDTGLGYLHHLGPRFLYRLSGNLRYVNYYKFANDNLVEPTLRAETAFEFTPHLFLESEYATRWFWKPHDAQGDFNEQEVKLGVKHYFIPERLYHKPSYIFQYRDFTKAKARVTDGTPGFDDRHDTTHRLEYEVGVHLAPWLLLRVINQYGRNDSNDKFLHFYDYSFYQVTPSVTWEIAKPLLLIAGVQFERNHYDDRAIRGRAERENNTAVFGSLFYNVTKSTSVGLHWVYVKDNSTLPELEYQDSSLSLGVHVHF